jgi:hypothetical protein
VSATSAGPRPMTQPKRMPCFRSPAYNCPLPVGHNAEPPRDIHRPVARLCHESPTFSSTLPSFPVGGRLLAPATDNCLSARAESLRSRRSAPAGTCFCTGPSCLRARPDDANPARHADIANRVRTFASLYRRSTRWRTATISSHCTVDGRIPRFLASAGDRIANLGGSRIALLTTGAILRVPGRIHRRPRAVLRAHAPCRGPDAPYIGATLGPPMLTPTPSLCSSIAAADTHHAPPTMWHPPRARPPSPWRST